jgi:hypothetical protein
MLSSPQHPDRCSGPTRPAIQPVPQALTLVVKRPGHEGQHLPPSSAKNYTSAFPSGFMVWRLNTQAQVKINLSLCLTNYALRHEDVWGSGCIDPCFLDLGTSWRWVVSFTPWPLYSRGKSPRYPLDRRLGGPQSRSERHREVKILAPDPSVVQPVASHYTDLATMFNTLAVPHSA